MTEKYRLLEEANMVTRSMLTLGELAKTWPDKSEVKRQMTGVTELLSRISLNLLAEYTGVKKEGCVMECSAEEEGGEE